MKSIFRVVGAFMLLSLITVCFSVEVNANKVIELTSAPYFDGTQASINSSWEIFYGIDTKFLEANVNNPGIKNKNNISGTFSNSATTYSSAYAVLRYWKADNTFDMLLYEYDFEFPVKSYNINGYDRYNCTIRFDNKDYNFSAVLYNNELVFDSQGQNYLNFLMNSGVTFKIYIEKETIYGTPSTYLYEINSSGFYQLYNQLHIN